MPFNGWCSTEWTIAACKRNSHIETKKKKRKFATKPKLCRMRNNFYQLHYPFSRMVCCMHNFSLDEIKRWMSTKTQLLLQTHKNGENLFSDHSAIGWGVDAGNGSSYDTPPETNCLSIHFPNLSDEHVSGYIAIAVFDCCLTSLPTATTTNRWDVANFVVHSSTVDGTCYCRCLFQLMCLWLYIDSRPILYSETFDNCKQKRNENLVQFVCFVVRRCLMDDSHDTHSLSPHAQHPMCQHSILTTNEWTNEH